MSQNDPQTDFLMHTNRTGDPTERPSQFLARAFHCAPRMGDLYRVKVPKAGCGHQGKHRKHPIGWFADKKSEKMDMMTNRSSPSMMKTQEQVHRQTIREALQKPLFPSRIEQNCSVRLFFTTSKNDLFFAIKIV